MKAKISAVILGVSLGAAALTGCTAQQTPTQAFVSSVRADAGRDISAFSDSGLIRIGKAICGVYRTGGTTTEVVAIIESNGYDPQFTQALNKSAITNLCPDLN